MTETLKNATVLGILRALGGARKFTTVLDDDAEPYILLTAYSPTVSMACLAQTRLLCDCDDVGICGDGGVKGTIRRELAKSLFIALNVIPSGADAIQSREVRQGMGCQKQSFCHVTEFPHIASVGPVVLFSLAKGPDLEM